MIEKKFSEPNLREMQFNVISALAQRGGVFLHQIRTIINDDCLVNDTGVFYFNVIKNIIEAGRDVDTVQFENSVYELGLEQYYSQNKDKIGNNLAKILARKISQANALSDAKNLARRYFLNKTIIGLEEVLKTIKDLPENTPTTDTEAKIIDFVRSNEAVRETEDGLKKLSDGIDDYLYDLLNSEEIAPGLKIGYPIIEQMCGGILPGTIHLIAARMKIGKSALLLNIALNAAKNGIHTLFLDMEMNRRQITHRAISNLGQVNLNTLKSKQVRGDPAAQDALHSAAEELKKIPFTWHKISGMSVDQYLALARKWVATEVGFTPENKAKPCLIVLDYMKLSGDVGSTLSKRDHELLTIMTNKIVDFVNQYEVSMFSAVQLNRDAEKTKVSSTANIGGSDCFGRLADTILEYRRKTPSEIQHDNTDLKDYDGRNYCGNSIISQLVVRDAETWDSDDYLALDFDGSHMTCREIERKKVFRKQTTSKPRKSRAERDDTVPT